MEFIGVEFRFSANDLKMIEAMLRAADPLVAAPSNIKDLYDIREFVINHERKEASLHAQVDNNILSTATLLASGCSISTKESEARAERTTAAVLAYFNFGGFQLEPNIALYEQAWRSTHEHSLDQLKKFRIADHVHPQHYIDIALGRVDRLEIDAIETARSLIGETANDSRQADFRTVLQNWRVSYCALLKLVEIERGNGSARSKTLSLIDWMADAHFFSLVPTAMAMMFLSPDRPGGLIKRYLSEDSERVSAGLQNAAWDCVYIKQWVDRAGRSKPNEIWFFSSLDYLARLLAKSIMGGADDSDEELRHRILGAYWPVADAQAIWAHYVDQQAKVEPSPEREALVWERLASLNKSIRQIEHRLNLPAARLTEN